MRDTGLNLLGAKIYIDEQADAIYLIHPNWLESSFVDKDGKFIKVKNHLDKCCGKIK